MTRALQRLIHVGCRQLGIDSDTRHDLQLRVTGKASLSAMTEGELSAVLDALKAEGFKPAPSPFRAVRPRAPRADVRFCHVMWRLLHEAGAVKVAGPEGLNAFVRARFGASWGHVPIDIDALRDWSEIADVVDALKAWCRRAGIKLEE